MGTFAVKLTGAEKRYRTGTHRTPVLDGLDLAVERGEFLVVVGPSGSGKSTLLRVLAGLEDLDGGHVEWPSGAGAAQERPPIGMVFQQPLLLPWLTVRQNVRFGQRYRANRKRFDTDDAEALLARLGIEALADSLPEQLSGGQAQRVAVARAVAVRPEVLLLDEPFGALDPAARSALQDWLRDTVAQLGLTVVLVTHDVDEALHLGHRIALLDGSGRVASLWDHQPPADRDAVRSHPLREEILAGYGTDASAPRSPGTAAAVSSPGVSG